MYDDDHPIPFEGDAKKLKLLRRSQLPLNDQGNAKRLLTISGEDLVFVPNRGKSGWAAWNGSKFSFLLGKSRSLEISGHLSDLLEEEAKARGTYRGLFPPDLPYRNSTEELSKFANRCGNNNMRRNALKSLEELLCVKPESNSKSAHLFTTANGTLDLRALVKKKGYRQDIKETEALMWEWASAFFQPGRRDHRPLKATSVRYDPMAKAPNFKAMLRTVFPDEDVRACFHRCAGAMLYGANRSQVMLMFRGMGGNGKSTLVKALSDVLGDYALNCPVELFLQTGTKNAGAATPEEINMPGARLAIASEPAVNEVLSGKAVKAFTGGDKRTARALYGDFFEYTPTAIPVLQFNETPQILEHDEGLRRRLVFVPFDVALHKLPPKERLNPEQIGQKLAAEHSGILNWMLQGYLKYEDRLRRGIGDPAGIDPPFVMLELKQRLLAKAEPFDDFWEDQIVEVIGNRLPSEEILERYERWRQFNGGRTYSASQFGKRLKQMGYETRNSNGRAHVMNIGWQAKTP